jgi:hypothetical protein
MPELDVRIIINAGTLAQIGLPNLIVSFFQPWGQYKGIKFSIY